MTFGDHYHIVRRAQQHLQEIFNQTPFQDYLIKHIRSVRKNVPQNLQFSIAAFNIGIQNMNHK